MKEKLEIFQQLSQLDQYFVDKQKSFNNLFTSFNQSFKLEIDKLILDVEKYLETGDFDAICSVFDTLKESHSQNRQYYDLKRLVENHFSRKISEISNKINSIITSKQIVESNAKEIDSLFKQLDDARCLTGYISPNIQQKYESRMKEFSDKIENCFMMQLNEINKLWQLKRFNNAIKLKDEIFNLKKNMIHIIKDKNQSIEKQIKNLEGFEEKKKDEYVQQFSNSKIYSYYSIKPAETIKHLEVFEDVFQDLIEAIKKSIDEKILEEIKTVENSNIELEDMNMKFQKIEDCIGFIPEDKRVRFQCRHHR